MLDDLNFPYTKDFEKLKLNPIHDQNLSHLIFDNSDKLSASKNDILDPITIANPVRLF